MRSEIDSGTVQPPNERDIAARGPHALRVGPSAPMGAVQSPTQRHCVNKEGW
jgi:hypothetical protein